MSKKQTKKEAQKRADVTSDKAEGKQAVNKALTANDVFLMHQENPAELRKIFKIEPAVKDTELLVVAMSKLRYGKF